MESEAGDPVMEHAHTSSGTAWQPLASPMNMWSKTYGSWLVMAHGNLFLAYNQQGGKRGVGKVESTNWLMLMEQRAVGSGTGVIQFREMLSAEPLTAPHGGFPELFQTGETYKGVPLLDHQHPHDVFGELAVLYSLPLSENFTWMLYGGPAGEPAFGPVTFLHRESASEFEATPLGHHLQDSTHISYGVVTSGLVFKTGEDGALKLEASAFNGREPDEDRVDLDFAPLDSFSGRATWDPGKNWSLQYSYASLVHPEAAEPGDIHRQTASVMYARNLEAIAGNVSATLLWGRNRKLLPGTTQNSYLLESVLNFQRKNYLFSRVELVDKDELFPIARFPGSPFTGQNFRVGAYTFGGVRDLVQNRLVNLGLGGDVTLYSKPAALDAFYGQHPVSLRIFLRVRPAAMAMKHSH